MGVSYCELASLEQDFEKQCLVRGITWIDEEVRQEAFIDFVMQYEEGRDPMVTLCGYGYE